MITHLYRFRSLENLLEEHSELVNQEIYFATPSELNDPMEGFKDIFWKGDEIVWENLFRHYLMCLDEACILLFMRGEDMPFGWKEIPIFDPTAIWSTAPEKKKIHEEIFDNFFTSKARSFIKKLSEINRPIRRDELSQYFRIINNFAIFTIYKCYERRKIDLVKIQNPELCKQSETSFEKALTLLNSVQALEKKHLNNDKAIDTFFSASRNTSNQLGFINHYNKLYDVTKTNKNFVYMGFTDEYVNQLEQLIYSDWYTACFMADCRNSSIWGSYGTKHTGVCLKFKVNSNDGKHSISLNKINGLNNSGLLYGDVQQEFKKIRYSKLQVKIDFFSSLGRLPIPTLNRVWYSNRSGKQSLCSTHLSSNNNGWRKKYWDNFDRSTTTKSNDWRYEKEYRLVLNSSMLDFSEPRSRTLKYNFNDLDGIIFRGFKFEVQRLI